MRRVPGARPPSLTAVDTDRSGRDGATRCAVRRSIVLRVGRVWGVGQALGLVALGLIALAPAARGDVFRVLPEDRQAIQARVDLIQQAQHDVSVVYYAMDTGRVSASMFALLRDAAHRGVRVRLLVDGLKARVASDLEELLIREGVELRHYHPPRLLRPTWINRRLHDKLLIVDGEHLIIGSRNLKDEHFGLDCVNYVDCDAYARGKIAAHAKCYFERLWRSPDVQEIDGRGSLAYDVLRSRPRGNDPWSQAWRDARTPDDYRRLLDGSLATLVSCHGIELNSGYDWAAGWPDDVVIEPLHDADPDKWALAIQRSMRRLIDSARHTLWIETPYPVFTDVMLEGILAARCRGVRVVLLTNSLSSTDRVATYAAFQNIKGRLLRAGVEVWEYVGPGHLHSKSMVVDDATAVIGSYNFDPRSEYLNLEFSIAAHDPAAATALRQTIHQQLAQARLVDDRRPTVQGMDPLPEIDRRIKMQLERLIVPAFRWLL